MPPAFANLLLSLVCISLAAATPQASPAPSPAAKSRAILTFDGLPGCKSDNAPDEPCQTPLPLADLATVLQAAPSGVLHARLEGETLDVAYTGVVRDLTYGRAPCLCCDLQTFLVQASPGVWSARIRSIALRRAALRLSIGNLGVADTPEPLKVLSAEADHALIVPAKPGELTSVRVLQSRALRGDRTIYVRRGALCMQAIRGCTIIYMADGENLDSLVANAPPALKDDLARSMLVGIADPPGDDAFGAKRAGELLLDLRQPGFRRMERFLLREVIPATERAYGRPAQRWVAGTSDGGSWALNVTLRHPAIFDGAIGLSPGLWTPPKRAPSPRPRIFVGTGALEGDFGRGGERDADALSALGLDVTRASRDGGHSLDTWNALFWQAVGETVRPAAAPRS